MINIRTSAVAFVLAVSMFATSSRAMAETLMGYCLTASAEKAVKCWAAAEDYWARRLCDLYLDEDQTRCYILGILTWGQ